MRIWARRGTEGQGWVRKQLGRIQGGGRAGVNSRQLSLKSCSKLKITPVLPELNSFQLKLQASSKEPVSDGNWVLGAGWASGCVQNGRTRVGVPHIMVDTKQLCNLG